MLNIYNWFNNPIELDGYFANIPYLTETEYDISLFLKSNNLELYMDAIKARANYSFYYAKDILDGPFKDGEDAIATNAYYSFKYAEEILNGRFEKGEKIIATCPLEAVSYAIDILKERFIEAEQLIFTEGTTIVIESYLDFLQNTLNLSAEHINNIIAQYKPGL